MIEGGALWLTFGVMAVFTVGLRGSFIVLGERGVLPPGLQRALRYAPAAALAALIAPDVLLEAGKLAPANPKLAAALAVIAVTVWSRNPWLPFILGMGVLLAMRKGFGW